MAWEALPSAAIGAVIALSGTLLADVRRDRQQRGRDLGTERRKYCVAFTVTLTEALGALRSVAARRLAATELRTAVGEAMNATYVAREQLLLSGSGPIVVAGEVAFHRLVDVRDAVRAGAELDSVEYHDAYHSFADALWRFRMAVREDLHEPSLAPEDLHRPDWTDRDRCAVCAARA
ncbi:hypothetical protein [Paractinoplanes toevensis]|uniref:Uncharacterized protein n=1 Tax=Paractinoplanes toevensis TaxID=571911 RepID=A0A919WC54_9ACTN|nr:hypothetical protein [Actinoplanes toevensis]GIM97373.1 hypothetical protein Ato02nite_091660 [Actinoplanes toevensis]